MTQAYKLKLEIHNKHEHRYDHHYDSEVILVSYDIPDNAMKLFNAIYKECTVYCEVDDLLYAISEMIQSGRNSTRWIPIRFGKMRLRFESCNIYKFNYNSPCNLDLNLL